MTSGGHGSGPPYATMDRVGMDRVGMDRVGMDRVGMDCVGMDRVGGNCRETSELYWRAV